MEGCRITRADGQGLLLEGYHRDARILRNEFECASALSLRPQRAVSALCAHSCPHFRPNAYHDSIRARIDRHPTDGLARMLWSRGAGPPRV